MFVSRIRREARAAWLIAVVLVLENGGCGYTSEYLPPPDGRIRPVWKENRVVLESAGLAPTWACSEEARSLATGAAPRPGVSYGFGGGFWVPRYYGPPIVVLHAGMAPRLPRPPIFMPSMHLMLASRAASAALVPSAAGLRGLSLGGRDSGYVLLVLAILALTTLPIISVVLATVPAESASDSARNIDLVNAMNDLARTPGSPCSYETLAAYGGGR